MFAVYNQSQINQVTNRRKIMLRSLHFFLVFCILASSLGVGVTEHLCSIDGRSASVFGLFADGCCNSKKACVPPKAATNQNGSLKRKPCCENKTKYTQNILKTTKYDEKKPIKQKNTLVCAKMTMPFFAAPSATNHCFNPKTLRFRLYKPPPLCRDICVLIQSFLC